MSRNRTAALLVAGSLLVGAVGWPPPPTPTPSARCTASWTPPPSGWRPPIRWRPSSGSTAAPIDDPPRAARCWTRSAPTPPPTASTRSTCGPSSPTRSTPPRASSTPASGSGNSTRRPRRPPLPTCPTRGRRSTGSTRPWSTRLPCNGIRCTVRMCSAELQRGDGRRRRRPSARSAVPAGAVVGDPVLLPDYLSSRDIRRSASTLPPVWHVGQY